jgi:tetratricopeptide (TPR) repeat protein
MFRCLFVFLCLALGACATPQPVQPAPASLFRDDLFAPPSEAIDAAAIFALSEPMRHFARFEIASQLRSKGAQMGLIHALYNKAQLRLEYDAVATRNAAQAFDARSGNCLSLVIMTSAFAKELGLRVGYQSAYQEETWSRSGDLLIRSGHVNITLGQRLVDYANNPMLSPMTIDFLPADEIRGLRVREIDEDTVVAMYMNNRAAEALSKGQLDDAYAWARAAISRHPGFLSAYNTLGVVYSRRGEAQLAATVFDHVLEREPRNTRVMANLARTLARLGRIEDSDALYRQLAQIEPHPPFHYFNLGQAAFKRNDFLAARDFFAREVARADYYHEFHFWLALAHFKLGETEQARRHLTLAQEASSSRSDRDLYGAKLTWLRGHRDP